MEVNSKVAFDELCEKLSHLMYSRTEIDKIRTILEEINRLDYRYPLLTNPTKAVLLIHHCCSLISPDDFALVQKCCQFFINLIEHQHIKIEGQTLTVAIQWCLLALSQGKGNVIKDVLYVVKLLLYSNIHNAITLLPAVVYNNSPILHLVKQETNFDVVLSCIQCLEACTTIPDLKNKHTKSNVLQLKVCAEIFLNYLTNYEEANFNNVTYNKILGSSIRGIQNIIAQSDEFLTKELGLLLSISRSFMCFGIKNVAFVQPRRILPAVVGIADLPTNIPVEKRGGKIIKQRKYRTPNIKDLRKSNCDSLRNEYVPLTTSFDVNLQASQSLFGYSLKTSDSDFSDTENGQAAYLGIVQGRVRQAALHNLLHIVQLVDKPTMFCYWSSFIPSDSFSSGYTLVTCFLKDPSPKGRLAALNVLLSLLTRLRLYFSQAEASKKYTAYTPFSTVLASTLQELHKHLTLALNENSIRVLTQVLKCLAALVQATPYHKLKSGITRKIVRNIKIYIKHRDATVQVAALIVLGCLLASEPIVPETRQCLLGLSSVGIQVDDNQREDDIEYAHFSSDDDEDNQAEPCKLPWLLEHCLNNLGVYVNNTRTSDSTVAMPIKLESLQVLSAMNRNYFDCLIAPYLDHITNVLCICLDDKYTDLRLHTGRCIDFIGQAISRHQSAGFGEIVTIEKGLAFWKTLLNSSLFSLLQNEEYPALRAVGCDCLGSIGPQVYEQLTKPKQVLIITSLITCSYDAEFNVKAAAVRALGICVLYPSLRIDDIGFVVDVGEVIYRTLQDNNVTVRIKASWSLGNLSDALVLNRTEASTEEIADDLLLRLLQISNKVSNDYDKVKVNAVRAIGNLLQLVTQELMCQKDFNEVVGHAVNVLLKNATTGSNMKVRWNTCYAIGNTLKNSDVYPSDEQRENVFITLLELVKSFSNFKVRINSALALLCPKTREFYGKYFYTIWNTLLEALENTQNVEDFTEYNHRDHLIEQICLTLGHLTTLLTVYDLAIISSAVTLHLDFFKTQMHRVMEHLLPEKSSVLLCATAYLNSLAADKSLSNQQQNTISVLLTIFTNTF